MATTRDRRQKTRTIQQNVSYNDIESKRARAQLALQSYTTHPLDDRPIIAPSTDDHRRRAMEQWCLFFNEVMQIDPNQIWLDLCNGSKEAMNYCRVYLRSYVTDSVREFVILGPPEYESRRTVNSASSVIQCWRELIAQADSTVLKKKRQEDPNNYNVWRLKYMDHTNQRGQGPIFEISQWIFHKLAKELDLATTTTYKKVEATTEDSILLIKTAWTHSEEIPCKPRTRISFIAILILCAIGGFRVGTVSKLKYKDVLLAVVRDPSDPSKTKVVVTITIGRNKLKMASRVSRSIEISFSITFVPYSPICLASLVASCAIKDDAFTVHFKSIQELLSRPTLENVDFLQLEWRESIREEYIFEVCHATFYNLWNRTCLVSGFRENPRFYAMRVGAGGRLDGSLTDALRNYILSNTTSVFQGSYQPHRVREDLTKLAFGKMAGQNNDLFQRLRNMSLRRDAGAPVRICTSDLGDFEKRSDLSNLRATLAQTTDQKRKRSIKAQIETILQTLTELKLQERRVEYFQRVDQLRAQGLPTMAKSGETDRVQSSQNCGVLSKISIFILNCERNLEEYNSVEERASHFIQLLVDYQANRPIESANVKANAEAIAEANSEDILFNIAKGKSRCLLCDKSFRGRSDLTKHCQRSHVGKGTFDQPFQCPECILTGMRTIVITGPSIWSNHVEVTHGKIHAPNLPSYNNKVECLLCQKYCQDQGGLWRHTKRIHELKQGLFQQSLHCPECHRKGIDDANILGFQDWKLHILSIHSDEDCQRNATGKRKRDEAHNHDASVNAPNTTMSSSKEALVTRSPPISMQAETREPSVAETEHFDNISTHEPSYIGDTVDGDMEQDTEPLDSREYNNNGKSRSESQNPSDKIARMYWGKGYSLVPEGCELNRVRNNARRRGEIDSNINLMHVIEDGKKRRRLGRMEI